ncbi:MAG: hypothetical protein ACPL3C_03705 [Pyrobaculum sp.]|uniref:hypothetical protein n=1 Tax=Pyrobaculum sp. TaxID=2004705 RepID=UPI003CA7D287
MSSVRELVEFLKALEELKKSIVKPIEEELQKAVQDVLYKWVTDLGSARELAPADVKELMEKVKRQLGL